MLARILLYYSRNSRYLSYQQDSAAEVERIKVTRGLLRK